MSNAPTRVGRVHLQVTGALRMLVHFHLEASDGYGMVVDDPEHRGRVTIEVPPMRTELVAEWLRAWLREEEADPALLTVDPAP